MPSLAKLLAQYLQSRLDRLSPEGLPQVAGELEAIAFWARLTDTLPPELRNALLDAAPDGVTPDADPVPAPSPHRHGSNAISANSASAVCAAAYFGRDTSACRKPWSGNSTSPPATVSATVRCRTTRKGRRTMTLRS